MATTTTKSKVEPGSRKSRAAAPRHEALGLSKEQLLDMYYYMLLARSLDERMWLLNRQGKAPFVISCQGHEAIQIGVSFAMERGHADLDGQIGVSFPMERGKDLFLPHYP